MHKFGQISKQSLRSIFLQNLDLIIVKIIKAKSEIILHSAGWSLNGRQSCQGMAEFLERNSHAGKYKIHECNRMGSSLSQSSYDCVGLLDASLAWKFSYWTLL